MIDLDEVSVAYRRHTAVHPLSLSWSAGVHALLGPNGAGKSSLLSVVAGLRTPTSGTITIDGATGLAERRSLVGFLPQDNLPRSRFTIAEHLSYVAWLRKMDTVQAAAEVARVLETTGLRDRSTAKIASLSGGWRRRVGIASALLGRPRALILDEPSAGLDVVQRDGLRRIIRSVAEETAVVLSTHLIDEVLAVTDSVTILSDGVCRYCGPLREFVADPADLATFERTYLEAVR